LSSPPLNASSGISVPVTGTQTAEPVAASVGAYKLKF